MALTDNLVSYWKLDESSGNAGDSVGSNDLTNNNTVTYSLGKINNGGDFVAANSESFTASGFPSMTGGVHSVAFWFKADVIDGAARFPYILRNVADNANYYIYVYQNGGVNKIALASWNGSGQTGFDSAATISTGTWYHFVGVFNGASSIIYLNGSSDATGSTLTINSGTDLNIGANSGASFYDGMIDEVGVWNRVLTSDEVSTLYNSGAGLQYPFTPPTSIKTINGLAKASVKTVNGLAIASVKTFNGLA